MDKIINEQDWNNLSQSFLESKPFNHIVIDDFFRPEIAEKLVSEFPDEESPKWIFKYKNAIEMYNRIPTGSPLQTAIEIRKALNLNSLDKSDEARSVLEGLLSTVSNREENSQYQSKR